MCAARLHARAEHRERRRRPRARARAWRRRSRRPCGSPSSPRRRRAPRHAAVLAVEHDDDALVRVEAAARVLREDRHGLEPEGRRRRRRGGPSSAPSSRGRLRRPHDRAQRQVQLARGELAAARRPSPRCSRVIVSAARTSSPLSTRTLMRQLPASAGRARRARRAPRRRASARARRAPARGARAVRGPTTTGLTSGCASSQASASVGHVDAALARPSPPGASSASKTLVALQVLVGLGAQRHARAARAAPASRRYLPVSQPPESGENGEKPRPMLGAQRQHLGLGRAVEQAVARLHPLEAREAAHVADPERAREPPGLDVAGADVVQLARAAQVVERAERLLERRRRVGLVAQEEVEALGAEARRGSRRPGAEERPPREAAVVRARRRPG